MADPNETVIKYHPDVTDEKGNPIGDPVTRHEYESVWKPVGWTLSPKKKEGK